MSKVEDHEEHEDHEEQVQMFIGDVHAQGMSLGEAKCTKLIEEHLQEIQNRISMHSLTAFRYMRYDRLIGYPVSILSSFIASSFMVGLFDPDNPKFVQIIGLTLSVASFFFSVTRDYMNFSKRFSDHDISQKLYTNLLRSIEIRLIHNHIQPDERRDIFRDISEQMSIIEQYEQPIPADIERKIRQCPIIPRSVQLSNCVT